MLIIWIVLGFYLVLSLCSTVLFWYENLNTPSPAFPALKPGLFRCAGLYASCLGNYLLCAVLLLINPFVRSPRYQPPLPPLLLIHGLYSRDSTWLFLTWYLRRKGFAVFTFSYSSYVAPESIIAALDERIRQVEYTHGAPLCICHSLGAVLLRVWMGRTGNQSRIRGVVSLAAPHGGSKLAVLAPTALGRALIPGSPLLEEASRVQTVTIPCLALVNPADQAVLPLRAQEPPQGWSMRLLPPSGHFTLLFRPAVARMILEAIGDPDQQTAGDAQ